MTLTITLTLTITKDEGRKTKDVDDRRWTKDVDDRRFTKDNNDVRKTKDDERRNEGVTYEKLLAGIQDIEKQLSNFISHIRKN